MDERIDILILTASFGNGHNSATQALIEEVRAYNPGVRIDAVDIFGLTTPKLNEYFTETYRVLTKRQPAIYNRLYALRSKLPKNPVDRFVVQMTFDKFMEYVEPRDPKVIISVFPTGAAFASYYKRKSKPDVRIITCITDVVDSWEWIYPNTDLYFAPSPTVQKRLAEKGVPSEQILITGVPVRKTFRDSRDQEPELPGKMIRQVLILGDAMGSVALNRKTLDRLGQMKNLKVVIITGSQKKLHQKLMALNNSPNIEIVGYTDRIADYMAQSDLVISKAGGATIFEAIEMELPMLIKPSRVGQESYNLQFIREAGIGELVDHSEDILERVTAIFQNKNDIQNYRHNIRTFKKMLNPDQIAPIIHSMLNRDGRHDFWVS